MEINFFCKSEIESQAGIRVKIARSFEELDQYAAAWNELALRSTQGMPFMTQAWVSSYYKHQLKENESWFCLFALDETGLAGVLPLLATGCHVPGMKCLKLHTPHNLFTLSVDFIYKEGYGQQVVQAFLSYLKMIRPRVLHIRMNQLVSHSMTFELLKQGIYGIHSSHFQYGFGSVIRITGSMEDYRLKLGKKWRRNFKSSYRKLKRLPDFKISVSRKGNASPDDLERFAGVEASGWKGEKGSAIIKNPGLFAFHEYLVHKLAEQQWLEWHFLSVENRTIAGLWGIPFGREYILYKTGYDEAYSACSPGMVLFDKAIEYVFNAGEYDRINCLTDFEWLKTWRMERIPYYNLTISFKNSWSMIFSRIPSNIYSFFANNRFIRSVYRSCIKRSKQ